MPETAAILPSVGFIGLGNMGWPMAARLAAAGYRLQVIDGTPGIALQFATETGATASDDGVALMAGADILITMLPTSAIVESVLAAVLPAMRPGTLVIDCTSGDPTTTRALALRVADAGGAMVDAPVSGGVPRAKTGQLAIMLGGADNDTARATPILEAMGSSILRTGAIGSAHAMKALNNLASAGSFLIGIEVLLIGARFGLDPALMVDVLNASTGMSNASQKKFRQFVLSRSFDSGFGLDLMVKDLSIAMNVARETQTAAPFAAMCREFAASAQAMLGRGADHTEFAKLSEALAGFSLSGE